EGRSLMPILRGEQDAAGWRQYVHGEHSRPWLPDGGCQFLAGSREKYTWFTKSGREWLFDLESDPQECVNLADRPEGRQRLEQWRARMVAELAKRPQDGMSDGKRLIPGQALPNVRPELKEPYFDNEGRPRPSTEVSRFTDRDEPGHHSNQWSLRL
ncbi:MAG: hypothetical protein JXL80_09635, partial [Planctomycetes bacterium]|nr:hypothetical protein [Planctomycetota bacterium]